MIRRIDIIKKNFKNQIIYQLFDKNKNIIGDSNSKSIIYENWIITFDKNNKLILYSTSKAKIKNNKYIYNLIEGSLFLVNSSVDFYSFFRKKNIQNFLDLYNIDKLSILSDKNTLVVKNFFFRDKITKEKIDIEIISRMKNMDILLPLNNNEVFSDNTGKIIFSENIYIYNNSILDENNIELVEEMLSIKSENYIFTKTYNSKNDSYHNILYLSKNISIENILDINNNDLLKEYSMKKIL